MPPVETEIHDKPAHSVGPDHGKITAATQTLLGMLATATAEVLRREGEAIDHVGKAGETPSSHSEALPQNR